MIIEFESPSMEEFKGLREKVGWGKISNDIVKDSLANSLFIVTVRNQEHDIAVGTGRVVGDGAMYFYIQDVIVDPEYQGQGVGDLIMKNIEEYLVSVVRPGATIGLLAAKGKEAFYHRYDYLERPSATLGSGMCKFVL